MVNPAAGMPAELLHALSIHSQIATSDPDKDLDSGQVSGINSPR